MRFYTALFLVCLSYAMRAQFTDVSASYNFLLAGTSPQSGCGVSFYDYDHDGWDDLTIGQTSNEILVYHNDFGDYNIAFIFPNTGDPKQLTWIDFDNDGDSDFFFCIKNNSCKLFRNDGANVFTDVTSALNLPMSNGNSFGACWGDYDNDGFLDVYIANYSSGMPQHTNWLLHNNGDGTFADVTAAMGVGDSFKPSYQCTWVDVNADGLLDLYVVNDFSWINSLFINNGTSFDSGASYGLNLAMEGMSIIWTDLDADLDLDVFIADNLPGNKLMRNDGGVMTDIASTAGVEVNSTCWGSLWMDYDHDGLDDLHISTSNLTVNGNQNYLFHNNGDYTFDDVSMTGDNLIVFASAKGDKNNDGYWDFIEMKQYPAAVRLYQNNGGSNHWLKTGLTGTLSNRDGVGTVFHYYYGGEHYIRHTFCGEGFLDQDSQYEILSLGSFTQLDSLEVKWPSGWVDKYYDLQADQFYAFVEGETALASIENSSQHMLCPEGNQVELVASEGVSYVWSNDSTEQSILVTEPGIYEVTITNEFGIQATASYEVTEYDLPEITADILMPSCYGAGDGCISLSASNGEISSVMWNGEPGEIMWCDLTSDMYAADITDENNCVQTLIWYVEEPDELLVSFTADTACYQSVSQAQEIQIAGGTGAVDLDWNDSNPLALTPGNHTVTAVDANLCIATFTFEVEQYDEIIFNYLYDTICPGQTLLLDYEISGVSESYSIDWFGADPEALEAGDHPYLITNSNECTLDGFVLVQSSPQMTLNIAVVNAANGNNGSASVEVDGGIPPFTFVWIDESTGSSLENIGQGVYPVIVTDAAGCQVTGQADIIDIFVEENERELVVFPNPCNEQLFLQLVSPEPIAIYNADGKLVKSISTRSSSIKVNVSDLPSGLYFLSTTSARARFIKL